MALSYLYVLEGAAYEAEHLSGRLQERLKLTPERGSSYYNRYRKHQGAYWHELRGVMDEVYCRGTECHSATASQRGEPMKDTQYKLDAKTSICDELKLASCGEIQPHGILIVANAETERITFASANAGATFPAVLAGNAEAMFLKDLLTANGYRDFRMWKENEFFHILLDSEMVTSGGEKVLALHFYRDEENLVLEWEVDENVGADINALHMLYLLGAQMSKKAGLRDFGMSVVELIRSKMGFDRVMLCRFEPDWDSVIVAESKVAEMNSFLDLRFPSTDIPAPARAIYRENPMRVIPDIRAQNIPVNALNGSEEPAEVNLSASLFRGTPKIHAEYLETMGTRASISLSIVVNSQLWGLLMFHTRSPRFLTRDEKNYLLTARPLVSAEIARLEAEEAQRNGQKVLDTMNRVSDAINQQKSLLQGLVHSAGDLSEQFEASGMAIILEGDQVASVGPVPNEEQLKGLRDWLETNVVDNVFFTTSLASAWRDGGDGLIDIACGALVIPLLSNGRDYLVFFRPQFEKTVFWGGNPGEAVNWSDTQTYHPRASFDLWKETVKGKSREWDTYERRLAEELRRLLAGKIGELRTREARMLKQLLPVCAWCRDVRNDEGYWQSVEAYMHENHDMTTTHGICKSCESKF